MHLVVGMTTMKTFLKYGVSILCIYGLTLCLLFKCIPDFIGDRAAMKATQHGCAKDVNSHVNNNLFKLNWDEKEHAFFKKVMPLAKSSDSNKKFRAYNDLSPNCMDEQPAGKFQEFTKLNAHVFVYSAYYDNRTGQPHIRIISAMAENVSEPLKLWCHFQVPTESKYPTFIDMDEFLIPHGVDRTWHDMLLRMAKTHQSEFNTASGFSFRNTFFDADFSRMVFSNELNSIVRTNRTQHFSHFRNKVMVRPERIFELGIHHVSRSWPDDGNFTVVDVSPEVAFLHHYRPCVLEFGIHCRRLVEDFAVPIKYGKALMDSYTQSVQSIRP